MNASEIALVRQTFERTVPLGDKVAKIFYEELFKIDPGLRGLFKGDMHDQGSKLLAALAMVVRNLDKTDVIVPAAENLAVRHLDYGVTSEHYPLVGDALMRTLEKGLGPEFTPEVRRAWASAYQLLADVMRAAAYRTDMTANKG